MRQKQAGVRVGVLTTLVFILAIMLLGDYQLQAPSSSHLQVRFLDVGQGDAIHIVTPDGYEVLIDGGATAAVLTELSSGRSFFDRSLDLVIATHPDQDHVGGLVEVLARYEVAHIMVPEVEHDTPAADAFLAAAQGESGVEILQPQAGQVIQLGASTTLTILSPRGDTTNWQSNNASIVAKLTYGEIDFLLTGDAPKGIENFLVEYYGQFLESEVLKLGHHGSDTSTSELFLDIVRPQVAVVSAGRNNRYGHPSEDVVKRVENYGSLLINTAEEGTIEFITDGITWSQQ
jgi:competence protein ComEC